MRFWRRRAPRSQKHISIVIVSSDAPHAISFRFSHRWVHVLMGMAGIGVAGLVWWGVSLTSIFGLVKATPASQGNAQLEEAHRQIALLSRKLDEMKQVTHQIRQLAGVTAFEATAPPPVTELASPAAPRIPEGEGVAWAEERSPFLTKGLQASEGERNLTKRQRILFQSLPSIWPVRGWITDGFERESAPLRRQHLGLDIAARQGAPVQAPADGVVVSAGWDHDLGWLLVIEHGSGFTTRYGHNASLKVERGDRVRRGQIIALVGSSGHSSAPHLHYEIWKQGIPVDPASYLQDTLRWDDLFGHRASMIQSLAGAL